MSWCDKLASVAGAGFGLDVHFAPSDAILTNMTPITDRLYNEPRTLFNITHQTSFEVRFSTEEGFDYGIEPTKMFVEFKHRMRPRPVSGGAPIMEMLSRPQPFTEMLPEVTKRLIEAALLVPGAKTRKVKRIGIISTTAVAEEEAPPGVVRFVEYIGRPWQSAIESFNLQIVANTGKGPGYRDRCFHTIVRPEDKETLMTITIDFQRMFTAGILIQRDELKDAVDRVEKGALRYFEDIGEGKRFDEGIIRESSSI